MVRYEVTYKRGGVCATPWTAGGNGGVVDGGSNTHARSPPLRRLIIVFCPLVSIPPLGKLTKTTKKKNCVVIMLLLFPSPTTTTTPKKEKEEEKKIPSVCRCLNRRRHHEDGTAGTHFL